MHRLTPLLLATPADMLNKARHDFATMEAELNAYTLFNFFVTCYHIADYVRAEVPAKSDALRQLLADGDFQMVRFLCNRGKHLELQRSSRDHEERLMGARADIARSGAVRSAEPVRWYIYVEGKRVDPIALGREVLAKWGEFFVSNGITR